MTDFSKAKGNKTLQSVADKSALMKAGAVVKQLPVKELKDNPDNEYLFGMEQSDIEHTTVGIKKNGFKGAINVYSCPDGSYEVYSGHIRKYAAIEAGLETIPCLVEPEPEETIKRRQLLGANLYGRNKIQSDNPILIARQIHYHRETLEMEGFKGDTREQIAVDFRISDSQVYKYETLLKLEPDLQDLAAERKAPWSILYTAKSFSKTEQEQLAAMINEASESSKESVTKREVKDFMNSILSKKPVNGQMNIEDYEESSSEVKTAYDRLPVQKPGNCTGHCFYCRNEECNGSQVKREHCIFDLEKECNMYETHERAIQLGINCNSNCCRDCDNECSLRCNYYLSISHADTMPTVHGEQSEVFSVDDNVDVNAEVDKENLPPADKVYKVYKNIGNNIRNYYELKNHLVNMHGKKYEYYSDPKVGGSEGICYRCSPRGICIDDCDEITWVKFIDILNESVSISKDNVEGNVEIELPVSEDLKVSEIERKIYKLEAEMSSGTIEQIFWSNPEEAKRIMQSLIALLEDEIEAVN